ncbi:ice-binding family protein [Corallococcus sp. bb12-1]|uniref:ice-binding family protein n=1 Tax=Corallococcus sp. bb12-1 TaxID=2996784 RepID=UPI002272126F|nr:ice-binding family protein [Corallococcus sp. bb12-1]MCY1043239.1 ice-binding family protein [Corallococcus sp. bb12-1]
MSEAAIATAPSLGTAQSFAVLGATTVTNTGPTVISGDLGVSPGTAITGFPPGIVVGGVIHAADAVASQAQADTTAAYNNLAGQPCDITLPSAELGGLTLVPGVYCFSSASAQLTGALTLNAQGNPNAVWVFKIASTLITASNSSVLLINGGQACNVFWQVGSSATVGTGSTFVGNILALTSITLTTDADISGRALARNGAVTLDSNTVTISSCAGPVTPLPPTLGKAFSPATIMAGGISTLTITLSNPDPTVATLTAPLTDTLPSGVTTAGAGTTTCGGTVTTTASSVTLTGGAIPANGSCTVTVPVTAASGGNYLNSIVAGALQTGNGSNVAPAVATLTVPQPATAPTVGKAFSPATISTGGTSTLTITLSNAGATAAPLTAPLTDTLPSGVTTTGAGTTTCGGVVTTTASSVTLTGGAIPANGSCTVTVPVTAPVGGSFINSIAAGALQTGNGSNAAPAVATLTVIAPTDVFPTLGKTFSPATISAGGISTLTITLSNASATPAVLTAPLTDTLPSGVTTAGMGSTTCGGVVTTTASSVTLTGGAIPANGSCTVTVLVTAPVGGSFINSIAAGALQTGNGSNQFPAIATLTVATPSAVTLGKAFSPATISAGGTSTLTLTLINSNATPAVLTAPLVDTLPAGLTVAGMGSTTCGGIVTTTASTVTLTGGAIPANGSCTVTVPVTAPVAGSFINSIAAGDLQTNRGNNAAPAVATLVVIPVVVGVSPKVNKYFSPSTIGTGGVSTLTITLTNPNNTAAALTAPLKDVLPDGLLVSGNAKNTCGGVVTAVPGSSLVVLTGGSIPANGSCTVTVDVTAKKAGSYCNTIPKGALQTNKGSNTAPATATLIVKNGMKVPPKLTKYFSPSSIKLGHSSTLTLTLSNPNGAAAQLTTPLVDDFPKGMAVSGQASTTCGGGLLALWGSSTVVLWGGTIPANGSCKVQVEVSTHGKGHFRNKMPAGALQTTLGSNVQPADATLSVY